MAEEQGRGGLREGQGGRVTVDALACIVDLIDGGGVECIGKSHDGPNLSIERLILLSTVVRTQKEVIAHITKVSTA